MQQSEPSMAAIVGPGGPSTAKQFAVDGPGGPVVVGDHLWRDNQYILQIANKYCEFCSMETMPMTTHNQCTFNAKKL